MTEQQAVHEEEGLQEYNKFLTSVQKQLKKNQIRESKEMCIKKKIRRIM